MASLGRIVVYARDLEAMAGFYGRHFGYVEHRRAGDRIIELRAAAPGGLTILLHPLGKGRREGQRLVKLVFDVEDVDAARAELIAAGVAVGPVHQVDGYAFANLDDPAATRSRSRAAPSGRTPPERARARQAGSRRGRAPMTGRRAGRLAARAKLWLASPCGLR